MKRLILFLAFIILSTYGALAEPPAGSEAPKPAPKSPDQQPAASIVGRFGDWALVCGTSKDKVTPAPCTLVQQLIDANSKKTVFHLTLGYGPQGNLVLIVRSPLGVALAKGLEVSLGGQTIHRAGFSGCTPKGCQAVLILTKTLQDEMRKTSQALITVYGLDGKAFRAASSLKGFGEGLSALDKRRSPS